MSSSMLKFLYIMVFFVFDLNIRNSHRHENKQTQSEIFI